jgi:hypothetical protein
MSTEDQLAASVPVTAIVVGPENTIKVRSRLILRAYSTRAKTGMDTSRAFKATVKGFNAEYGTSCKTWAEVAVKAEAMLEAGE